MITSGDQRSGNGAEWLHDVDGGVGVVAEAEQQPDEPGADAERRADREERAHRSGGVQGRHPAEAGSGQPGDQQERQPGDHGDDQPDPDQVPPPAAPATGEQDHQERQGHRGGRLDRDREGDQGDARQQVAVDRENETGQHRPEHQRLVVTTGDQMEQHQRVQHGHPERGHRVHPTTAGEPGHRPDDHRHAEQLDQALHQHAEDDVFPGERHHALGDQQEARPVGRVVCCQRASTWWASGLSGPSASNGPSSYGLMPLSMVAPTAR